jgi:hypothetical protein
MRVRRIRRKASERREDPDGQGIDQRDMRTLLSSCRGALQRDRWLRVCFCYM